jgi:hypothetical protein
MSVSFSEDWIIATHKQSIRHRSEVEASDVCGCFFCSEIFFPSEIEQWTDNRQTALCPKCSIDSVIGDKSGFPISDANFLKSMNHHWFQIPHTIEG